MKQNRFIFTLKVRYELWKNNNPVASWDGDPSSTANIPYIEPPGIRNWSPPAIWHWRPDLSMLTWELWQSNDHCNSTILQSQWKIAPQFRRNIDQSDTIFTYCFLWKPNCTPDLSNISKFSGTGSSQQGRQSSTNGTDNGDGDAGTDEPAQWLLAPLVGSCLGRRGSDPTKGASWRVWLVNDIWRHGAWRHGHGAMRVSWVMSFCSNFYWPLLECYRWWLVYCIFGVPLNWARSCNNNTGLWIISKPSKPADKTMPKKYWWDMHQAAIRHTEKQFLVSVVQVLISCAFWSQ